VPFLVRNFGTFGVTLNWEVFDFGRTRAAVHEREAQLAQAEENNLQRLKRTSRSDRATLPQGAANREVWFR
jgi:outer membrane protein TolC